MHVPDPLKPLNMNQRHAVHQSDELAQECIDWLNEKAGS